jgi:hypothetical protein
MEENFDVVCEIEPPVARYREIAARLVAAVAD